MRSAASCRTDGIEVPREQALPACGADTAPLWRWQGTPLPIKALLPASATVPKGGYHAVKASRNCRFITLPFALRGKGSEVTTRVSGTL